ncbi:MAG: PAS domain-containing sensor histidine kinase [Cyanobacteria bacterium SIG28]|nr:PAS domain-containing sensor histidine kinase [Cyanobacteria bacterium SIG28]
MKRIEDLNFEIGDICPACKTVLNTLFEECPDGFVLRNNNLKYEFVNKSFCKFFNIDSQKIILGNDKIKTLSFENQKLVKQVNNLVLKERKAINYVMNHSLKDNDHFFNITTSPIFNKNKFMGIVSIIKDITDEENIKEKFVNKHFQLKSILENIPLIIYMQDKEGNYITGSKGSKQFAKSGFDIFCNIHLNLEQYYKIAEEENEIVIKNNKSVIKEKEITDYNNNNHWYKIYKVPVNNLEGQVSGILTIANNIDEEKRLQIQREAFVATLGHDLKNPTIAQIRGLELLLKGDFGHLTEEQKELLEMIIDSCRYMNGMLSTLLATYRDCSGILKLSCENFLLSDLVSECISEMLYVAKDKSITISLQTNNIDSNIFADRVQIKRVIMNLISNGIKYAYKDSTLKLLTYLENENICFEFENHSPYIPEDKQKSIFAQYVSYAGLHQEFGIGLGLYASQKIIEGHNGEIFVKSYKDNRNIFGFKIPIKPNIKPNYKEICF